ncbi:MAG: site-2 protease family protein [Microgenomates group bacterium]
MVSLFGFIIFIYSIILHEIAHGLAAERLGDPTARLSGRLSLKPGPHIDPLMSIVVPLLLVLSGSPIIFGSAKPVPIDPYNLRNPRKDMGLVGLAGPVTNLGLAIAFSFLARLVFALFPQTTILEILKFATQINIFLAVFNLIPIPPLDGGRVMVAILPEKYSEALASIESLGIFIVLFFLLFPNPLFSLEKIIVGISSFLFSLIFPNFPLV